VGGAWGLSTAMFLATLVFLLSLVGDGEPTVPTQILLVTTIIGALSGVVGGAIMDKSAKTGGSILIGGASLALLGWAFQERGRTSPGYSVSALPVAVFFLGWIALVMVAGFLAFRPATGRTRLHV